MTIALEQAEAIGNWVVCCFGLGLTFIGLICIILICSIMGVLCKKFIKGAPEVSEAKIAVPAKKAEIANKGEFVAAVAAAIAEDIGTDVSGIKVLSIKQK